MTARIASVDNRRYLLIAKQFLGVKRFNSKPASYGFSSRTTTRTALTQLNFRLRLFKHRNHTRSSAGISKIVRARSGVGRKLATFSFYASRAKSSVFDLLRRKFGLIQSAKISLRKKKTTIWIIDFIDQNKLWFNGMFTVLPSGTSLLMIHQSIVRFHKITGSIRLEMETSTGAGQRKDLLEMQKECVWRAWERSLSAVSGWLCVCCDSGREKYHCASIQAFSHRQRVVASSS